MEIDADRLKEEVFAEQLGDILDTVTDKAYPTPERRVAAQQTAALSVTGYNPRDPVETTMAGHCVIYDNLLRHMARDLLSGQDGPRTAKALPGILNCGKMYLATLAMMHRMREQAPERKRPMPEREETVVPAAAAVRRDQANVPLERGREAPDEAVPVVEEPNIPRSPDTVHSAPARTEDAAPPEVARREGEGPSRPMSLPQGPEASSGPAGARSGTKSPAGRVSGMDQTARGSPIAASGAAGTTPSDDQEALQRLHANLVSEAEARMKQKLDEVAKAATFPGVTARGV